MASTWLLRSHCRFAERMTRHGAMRLARSFAMALVSLLLAVPPVQGQAVEHAEEPAVSAIGFYQRYLSSLRHAHCRYRPSCSEFAAQAIARYGLVEGSARAADRLMRCNASAEGVHTRGADGRLDDPVDPGREPTAGLGVPNWLLPPPEAGTLPQSASLTPDARARIAETLEFARVLERRGQLDAVAIEYQRAAFLADTLAADAWAFSIIGHGAYRTARWIPAEQSYLIAAMLMPADQRAPAAFRAAASRFNAGSFAACARLLDDPAFSPRSADARSSPATSAGGEAGVQATYPARAATLGALCLMARGDWAAADARFERARTLANDRDMRERIARLPAFVGEGPRLPHRSPALASAMSAVLPGAGQAYCGRGQDALRHLVFNAALIYSVVALARAHEVPGAVVVGSVALPFYAGNVIGAHLEAARFNRARRLDLLRRALRDDGPSRDQPARLRAE